MQGLVWPQNSSEQRYLSKAERIRGFEVLAEANRGRDMALVLGVQAEDTAGMMEYADIAEDLMEQMLIRDVKFDIGGDAQQISSMNTRYTDITFKHVLLPIWLASYRWQNKSYRVVVNGRTGQVAGERPYSIWKIAFAVVLGIAVAGAIGYAVAISQ